MSGHGRHMALPGVTAGIVLALLALLATGCGSGASTSSTLSADGSEQAQGQDPATIRCGSSEYGLAALASAPPLSSLPDGPAAAVDDLGRPAFDGSQGWRVVLQDASRVYLVRELEEPFDNGGGDVRDFESRTLERSTGASNVPDGTWMLTSAGPCAQRLVLDGGLAEADLTLADTLSPDDTALDLLVTERACASGESAEGRIEVVELEETAEQVRLRLGVRPQDGGQNCQGNPATAFTVELAEPLGDREVVDASVLPARPVTMADPG